MEITLIVLAIFGIIFLFAGIRLVNQYERAVKFRLGRFAGLLSPGINWVIPFVEWTITIDVRIVAMDIPTQEVMSSDNVPIKVNGAVFYKVVNAERAVLQVENYTFAVSQLSQAALREMTGKAELDSILSKRDEIGNKIKELVDKETEPWGIDITDVKIKDIDLPENMKRAMAHQAEAERDRRAQIILADAEAQAAKKLAEAGKMLEKTPASMQLRLYQTLSDIAAEKNSTIVLPFPVELLDFLKKKQ